MAKLGSQNPTQSVILPYFNSYGDDAIELYEKSKRKAQKWQKDLVNHILAFNDEDLWVHTKFGLAVPRRNGKNEVVLIRELYGLFTGEEMLHTAHRTNTSHTAWERLVKVLEEMGYTNEEDFTTLKAKGNEEIRMSDGGVLKFRTRTSTGGLGEGYDLLVIDEAQEYTDDQLSALKYVVTSSKNPQTIYIGTPPTLVSSGTVFVNFRDKTLAHAKKNAGWAEWGVTSESDPRDKDLWYKTNPSLGTIFTERSIEDEIGEDDIDFNIQRLGLWLTYNQKSAILEKDWKALQVNSLPFLVSGVFAGVKYGKDGNNVSLSIAVKTLSKKIFIETIDCRPIKAGNLRIVNFLKNADIEKVVVDGAGNQNILEEDLKEYKIKVDYCKPTVKEVIVANAKWEKAITQKSICHMGQPSLFDVATNCEKRFIGSAGGFGYKSQFEDKDISLMDSAILAHWASSEKKEKKKQRVYY